MNESEINNLIDYSVKDRMKLYVSICKMFLTEDCVGQLYIRGESKLIWNLLEVRLDYNSRTLNI
jgi:hypothetical protein